MAIVMNDEITALDEIITPENYAETKQDIDRFMQTFIRSRVGKVDTIVKVARKGYAIFSCFEEENPELRKFLSVRDDETVTLDKEIKGARVLIFDDSIRTGSKMTRILEKVLALEPKSVEVCVLLINEGARKALLEAFENVVISSFRVFSDYSEQSDYFVNNLLSFLEGLKCNLNTDFSSLRFLTAGNIEQEELVAMLSEIPVSGESSIVNLVDLLNLPGKQVYSILVDSYMPKDEISNALIEGIDHCKIRVYFNSSGTTSRMEFVPIIVPFVSVVNPETCPVSSVDDDHCLVKFLTKLEIELPGETDRLCLCCALSHISLEFVLELETNVRKVLAKHGIKVLEKHLRMPLTHVGNITIHG